jgi:putative selenate reductase
MIDFVGRLGETAASSGRGFGVKFTNTLVVENHRDFFPPAERDMYLSGQPLHVLAIELVRRFRRQVGDRSPISFSAGVDQVNFPDAVALGLVPVTVCTDLLRPGGYARGRGYLDALVRRMRAVGAADVDDYVLRAYGHGLAALDRLVLEAPARERCARAFGAGAGLPEAVGDTLFRRWVGQAALANTEDYADRVLADERYTRARNARPPRKIGRRLRLFDCISCDKCVPVCPNDANFAFRVPPLDVPIVRLRLEDGRWRAREHGRLAIREPRQFATFADFCNDCGNCDVFCPEDGGPYLIKPRFYGTAEAWASDRARDGFFVARTAAGATVLGRFDGREYRIDAIGSEIRYSGDGFAVAFDERDPVGSVRGEASVEVDLTYFHVMHVLQVGVLSEDDVNWVNTRDVGS